MPTDVRKAYGLPVSPPVESPCPKATNAASMERRYASAIRSASHFLGIASAHQLVFQFFSGYLVANAYPLSIWIVLSSYSLIFHQIRLFSSVSADSSQGFLRHREAPSVCGYSVATRTVFSRTHVKNPAESLSLIISPLTQPIFMEIRRGTSVVKGIVRTRNSKKPPEGSKDND